MKTVGIRFRPAGKVYTFEVADIELVPEDRVVVETERGMSIGRVASTPAEPESPPPQPLKKVLRLANDSDIERSEENAKLEVDARRACIDLIVGKKLDMKLLSVDCLFDRSKVIFYFAAEGRIDFRELVRDLARQFHTRIEMRQVGVRDEAKMVGGLGCCGRELCCATWMVEFAPISVRMAKSQNISLNPAKISGVCGRLMCCLSFENKMYEQLSKNMPKLGKRVDTPKGEGKVIRRNALEGTFVVITNEGELEISAEDYLQFKNPEAKPKVETRKEAETEESVVVPGRAEPVAVEGEEAEGEGDESEPGEGGEEGETSSATGDAARKNPRRRRRRRKKPSQAREKKADG